MRRPALELAACIAESTNHTLMTTAVAIPPGGAFMGRPHATRMLVWLALVVMAAMMLLPGIPEAMKIFPKPWMLPINQWVSAFVNWLLRDFHLGPIAFRDITRALGFVIEAPVLLLQRLLAKGFQFEVSGNTVSLPPLSWAGIVIAATALAATLRTRWLTPLVAGTLLYVGFIGLWQSAMMTLALVLIAVIVGVMSGLLLGIWEFSVSSLPSDSMACTGFHANRAGLWLSRAGNPDVWLQPSSGTGDYADLYGPANGPHNPERARPGRSRDG